MAIALQQLHQRIESSFLLIQNGGERTSPATMVNNP